eukprot:c40014_g1_i1.p1 GENE.c40014_g1_i1~~c40014_g1_i1.p1  ORF type:complete len:197 (+),score=38.71 c40014_g1_i1:164-754(+)
MFSLIYGFWKYYTAKKEQCALIVGLDGAGKTTLLERIKSIYQKTDMLSPSKISPTIGLNLARIDMGRRILTLWDVGGQSSLRPMWDKYYLEADAIIFALDASDLPRMEEARFVLEALLEDPRLTGCPILLLFNKTDKDGATSAEILDSYFRIERVAATRAVHSQAVVAITGDGVQDAIEWLEASLKVSTRHVERAQ